MEFRQALRENDHFFVEAARLEGNTLYVRVWGYGQRDAHGFRWRCEYALSTGTVFCSEERSTRGPSLLPETR